MVTPYDFAAIYDVQPLWTAGTPIDGTGQTIAVAGQSDINAVDFVNFRNLFGLPLDKTNTPTGTQHLNIVYNGADPGFNASEASADAQTQWAGAVAKGATIDYIASQSTQTTQGIDLSAAYIVDNNLAPVMSYAGSRCELAAGSTFNSFINNLWQQAAAQGITVLVSAGDNGSAGCDAPGSAAAQGGLAVNAVASTPYDVAVGGTDFYMPSGGSAYWNSANSPSTQSSAKGYVPEMAWNDSCVNAAFAAMQPYTGQTPEQVCNDPAAAKNGLLTVFGGSGGASSCTQASGSTSSSCTSGYPKPSWQVGAGVPADSARDVPDVSLFAGDGAFNTFYFFCQQSADANGQACSLSTAATRFSGDGGTAFSSAAFAGIMSLVNQQTGARQGNANYVLYNLAAQQAKSGTGCNATGSPASGCLFHDITMGTNAMPCVKGSSGCSTTNPGDTYGVLGGWASTPGYDLATGLGSLDAANLVNGWSKATFASTNTTLTLSSASITHGSPVMATVDVTSTSGTPTGDVSVNAQAANGSVGAGTLTSGAFTTTLRTFPGGTYGVVAHYEGDGTFASSDSSPVSLTVLPEASTTTLSVSDQQSASVTNAAYGEVFSIQATVAGVSNQGFATGNVNFTDNGSVLYGGVYHLNSSGIADVQTNALSPGTHSFVASYGGDPSFNASNSSSAGLTITKAPTNALVTSNTSSVSSGGTVTLTGTIYTTGYGFQSPSGVVLFQIGTTAIGQSTLVPTQRPSSQYDSSTAVLTIPASNMPNGPNQVHVYFAGDTNYLSSSSASIGITVAPSAETASSTLLSLSSATVPSGGSLTFTATVTPGGPAPTGTVQFTIDGQNQLAPVKVSNGVATASISVGTLALGSHMAAAVYMGDNTYKSSQSNTVSFVITAISGTTASTPSISLNPSTVVQGTGVLVSTTVTPASPVATGNVQLLLDGSFYGSPLALNSGSATLYLPTATLQIGTHSVSVFYAGDATYAASYSGPATLVVTSYGGTRSMISLTGLPKNVSPGMAVQFSATITPSTPTPTGVVQFIVDKGRPSAAMPFSADPMPLTLPTAGLGVGQHTVSVYYSGDQIYSFATSPDGYFTIVPLPQSFSLTPSTASAAIPPTSNNSNAIALTATPLNGFAGTVSFACGQGLPAHVSCVFSPSTVALGGTSGSSVSLTFVLASGAARINGAPLHRPGSGRGWYETGAGVTFAGLLLLGVPRRRRRWAAMAVLLAAVAMGAVSGCGSGGREPLGPFTVIVTATSGSLSQTSTITLNIE